MNDNDLIMREDAVKAAVNAVELYFGTSSIVGLVNAVKHSLTILPAAPREMTAREYFKQLRRLQNWAERLQRQCHRATETLFKVGDEDNNHAIEEIEKWAREHPEEADNANS